MADFPIIVQNYMSMHQGDCEFSAVVQMKASKLICGDKEEFQNFFDLQINQDEFELVCQALGGIMSTDQFEANADFCYDVSVDGKVFNSLRPPNYGRAALIFSDQFIEVTRALGGKSILIDVKGCGVAPGRAPSSGKRKSGLLTLNDAIVEIVNYKTINRIAALFPDVVEVVPHFGIVELGFQVSAQGLDPLPACTILRAPHFRDHRTSFEYERQSPLNKKQLQIELLLQDFGITTVGGGYEFFHVDDKVCVRFRSEPAVRTRMTADEFERMTGIDTPSHVSRTNIQLCSTSKWSDAAQMVTDLYVFRELTTDVDRYATVTSRDGFIRLGPIFQNRIIQDRSISARRNSKGFLKCFEERYGTEKALRLAKSPHLSSKISDAQMFGISVCFEYLDGKIGKAEIEAYIEDYVDARWEQCLQDFEKSGRDQSREFLHLVS